METRTAKGFAGFSFIAVLPAVLPCFLQKNKEELFLPIQLPHQSACKPNCRPIRRNANGLFAGTAYCGKRRHVKCAYLLVLRGATVEEGPALVTDSRLSKTGG